MIRFLIFILFFIFVSKMESIQKRIYQCDRMRTHFDNIFFNIIKSTHFIFLHKNYRKYIYILLYYFYYFGIYLKIVNH